MNAAKRDIEYWLICLITTFTVSGAIWVIYQFMKAGGFTNA